MLKEYFKFTRKKAVLLTVEFNGTVEEYAMAWLKLTNNAREYNDMIWKISNCRGNTVFVYCNPKSADVVKEFCTGIVSFYHKDEDKIHLVGEVVKEEEVEVGVPVYEYESTCNLDNPQWETDIESAIYDWINVECE